MDPAINGLFVDSRELTAVKRLIGVIRQLITQDTPSSLQTDGCLLCVSRVSSTVPEELTVYPCQVPFMLLCLHSLVCEHVRREIITYE